MEDNWEGGQYETEKVQLVDEPTGKPIILRTFTFKFPPNIEGYPTEKELIEEQTKRVHEFLWKDELVLIEKLRVTINREENMYMIHATCQVKPGGTLLEKPLTLEDVIGKNDTRRDSI